MLYRRLYMPDHPRADITGMVGEHILVMEKKLKMPIPEGFVVHHKNWWKPDNDPNNLIVMSRTEHQRIPLMQGRFLTDKGLLNEFFLWWAINKDKVDKVKELEVQLVRNQNERERMERKLINVGDK